MAILLLEIGNHETKSKPIPQYSMRGYIMRRKWKKANVNSSSFTMMTSILFLISILNTAHECAGREIRGTTGNSLSSSRTFYNSNNNATYDDDDGTQTHVTWIVERKECERLENGCICSNKTRNMTTVTCRCDNDTQVAHIQSPGHKHDIRHSSSFVQKEKWIWRFEQCSKVILHSDFLITVDGSHFQVEFFNISSFTIHDSAFTTKGSNMGHGTQNQVSVHFDQCKIDRLPTKMFPSFLNTIRFTRCAIKSLEFKFIYALRMGTVKFESSSIDTIESEAFHSNTIIDTLNLEDCTVRNISRNGVASAFNNVMLMDSAVQVLQEDALSGTVANVTMYKSQFAKVESNGFMVKDWSKVILYNNTFAYVARRGIDLSYHTEPSSAEIIGNNWGKVERDFIAAGSSEDPFISVSYNTFQTQCDCGNTFVSYLSTNGSKLWFHQELLNNSKCPVSNQVLECLVTNGHLNSTESNLLPYDALNLLCDSKVYMCMYDVSEVGVSTTDESIPGKPQLPNRLKVLAYFIAVMGIFIIVSLLITMCVFLCRKKIPRKKTPPDSPLQNMENAQGKKTGMPKSLSGGEYADIVVFKHNNGTSASRPRSILLEDVEMEDKGVQTMPTELSSEVLEGLREKLKSQDSFWDAKETIDHLYDLIQVKELSSGLSSPPDVTMCNGQSTTASTARLLPSTSSSPVAQITSAGVSVSIGGSESQIMQHSSAPPSADSSPVSDTPPPLPTTSPPTGVPLLQRYAQIRNKAKTAPLCEYADPSDSSMHIYSELTPHSDGHANPGKISSPTASHSTNDNKQLASPSHVSKSRESPSHKNSFLSATRRPPHNGPIICEYTEPKDVQTHVYAELSNNPSQPKSQPSSKTSSPVKSNSVKSAGTSPFKPAMSQAHVNTITIAVPPPPITIPHSNSFHNSPRHLSKIKENELSSSNPSIATATTPVKIIHVSDIESSSESKNPVHRRRWPSEKLKRSQSNADASGARSSTSVSSLLKLREIGSNSGTNGSDTQKRPLPSIPSWPNKNEAKSQF